MVGTPASTSSGLVVQQARDRVAGRGNHHEAWWYYLLTLPLGVLAPWGLARGRRRAGRAASGACGARRRARYPRSSASRFVVLVGGADEGGALRRDRRRAPRDPRGAGARRARAPGATRAPRTRHLAALGVRRARVRRRRGGAMVRRWPATAPGSSRSRSPRRGRAAVLAVVERRRRPARRRAPRPGAPRGSPSCSSHGPRSRSGSCSPATSSPQRARRTAPGGAVAPVGRAGLRRRGPWTRPRRPLRGDARSRFARDGDAFPSPRRHPTSSSSACVGRPRHLARGGEAERLLERPRRDGTVLVLLRSRSGARRGETSASSARRRDRRALPGPRIGPAVSSRSPRVASSSRRRGRSARRGRSTAVRGAAI